MTTTYSSGHFRAGRPQKPLPSRPLLIYSGTEGKYGCLCNFYMDPFEHEGKIWPSIEHWFQSQKFTTPEYQEQIRQAKTPDDAKELGSQRRPDYRPDWPQVREAVMMAGLRSKFNQNEELRRILIETGDVSLAEYAPDDALWGDGGDGKGKNLMGVLLAVLRDELKKAEGL
ncbi:NADAR family protein [Pelomyxa schiedti]|nr:NADAR family protein [Pelomyxa schiedti]